MTSPSNAKDTDTGSRPASPNSPPVGTAREAERKAELGPSGPSGEGLARNVETAGTDSDETEGLESTGDPGARGGYGEAVPGGSASRLSGEPSGTTGSRTAEPFDERGEPFDEDP